MEQKSERFPKKKATYIVRWLCAGSTAKEQRRKLAEKWLKEKPYSQYKYFVERCTDGNQVYLKRPTWLNKGFDFQVNLEGFRVRGRSGNTKEMPSHGDIIRDLRRKVKAYNSLESELFEAICGIFDCRAVANVLRAHPKLRRMKRGLPIDAALRVIKWLFIEQDLTYWNGRGRNMFMEAIERKVFQIDTVVHLTRQAQSIL